MSAEVCLSKVIPQGVAINYAEIGVLRATNLVALAEIFPKMQLTGIDAYKPYVDIAHGYSVSAALSQLNYKIASDKIASSPHVSRISLIVEDSSAVALATADSTYDVVFIDKSLSVEGQAQDILDWYPKVRSGGILCGHDANTPCIYKSVVDTLSLLGMCMPSVVDNEVWFVTID